MTQNTQDQRLATADETTPQTESRVRCIRWLWTERRMFDFLLSMILAFTPGRTCCLGVADGAIVEVHYSDAPFGLPWLPTWTPAVVRGNRLVRTDGNGYFDAHHVKKHLEWRVRRR